MTTITGHQRRVTPVLAAAATVTALAAGAVVFSQTTTAVPVGGGDLDRCWSAIEQVGKADEYPDRDEWRQVAVERQLNDPKVRLLAYRAEGVPLFCGLTATTATVSSPAPPENAGKLGVRALLALPGGPIGGIVDGRESVEFRIQLPAGWTGSTGEVTDGLFVSSGPGGQN